MLPYTPRRRSLWPRILLLVLLTIVAIILWQRQPIADWWQLRGYTPPSEINTLADETTMTDDARRLFYIYHPSIEDSATFNEHCDIGEFTIVLGCYVSGRGIYIFRVNDARLSGIEEVTAAHEMLHAAYERLSSKERKRIDGLTEQAFQQLTNDRIRQTIEQYRQKDASVVPTELHSILGTEAATLPAELETYYKRYFTDRSAVVGFSTRYETAFSERKAQADAYEQQLSSLKTDIEAKKKQLSEEENNLQTEYKALESSRESSDAASFNGRATVYNRKVDAYNKLVTQTSALIDRYNSIYEQYKQVVLEQQDLYKSINSHPETIQTQ